MIRVHSYPLLPREESTDWIAREEPLEIRLDGDSIAVTMRTPGEDAKLALGFLFAEGILRDVSEVGTVRHCGQTEDVPFGNVIDVLAAPGVRLDVERVKATRRGTLTTSACGICGRQSVDDLLALCQPVTTEVVLSRELVVRAPALLREQQEGFERTGGTHAAAALDVEGRMLAVHEDVGRHNAVDKVVGSLLMLGLLGFPPRPSPGAALLVVSGRASFEILQKAALARIPVVASVSAPSSLAVDLAERSGITLAGFVRSGSFNLYTHPRRISE